MTTLALCMIARDEEKLLADCLKSLAGLVDELVVVDTGSVDRTALIAREHGAKVVPFSWTDDFAAARNAALAASTSEWILVLDADERLAAGSAVVIRREIELGGFECGFLVLYNALRASSQMEDVIARSSERYDEPTALPRLFRRDAELHWLGCVHENVTQWLNTRVVKRLDAAIVHYGYTPEIGLARGKKQRNLGLLERWCAAAPDDPIPWTYLAWERSSASDPAIAQAAAAAAENGWQALLRLAAAMSEAEIARRLPSPVALATVRTIHQLGTAALDAAHDTLQQAAAWGARHPNLELLRAQLAERRAIVPARDAELQRACQAYANCLAMGEQVFTDWLLDGATTWFAATGLGLCLVELAAPGRALEAFDQALQSRATHVPALLGRAEALVDLRRPGDALAALLPLLEDAELRKHADAWLLAAQASQQLGQRDDARAFAQRAESALAGGGTLHPWRAPKLQRLLGAASRKKRRRSR